MAILNIDPVDKMVGERVRMARIAKDLSQSALGKALGVTFQQIQKYENGINRIAPGRLSKVSHETGMPIAWFYDQKEVVLPKNQIDAEIVEALALLPGHVKKPLRDLIVTLAGDQEQ